MRWWILLLFLAFPLHAQLPKQGEKTRLNVIVLDICSARADHFGFYGYSRPTTPNLDALAKESVVFDHAMSQSSWCLPNYASLFTGHVPEVHGQYSNRTRPRPAFEIALAERMKQTGYRTAAFSGGPYLLNTWELDKGFDVYTNDFPSDTPVPTPFSKTMPKILKWLHSGDKAPFFLYAAVDDLHVPYQSINPEMFDPGYEGIVHDPAVLGVPFERAYNGGVLEAGDPLKAKLDLFRKDPRSLAHVTAHYDAALVSVDQEIREFVRRLKAMGLWDKTVLIVTADHGEMLGEHKLLGHTQGLYEPVVHVPLLIHHPGFSSMNGKRIAELVERIDLTPTILETAGAPMKDMRLQGQSLIPLLRGDHIPWRTYAYASSQRNLEHFNGWEIDERVLRDKRWKLHWYLYKDRYELYDLKNDPQETRDAAGGHPDIVGKLSLELLKQVEKTRPHEPGMPDEEENSASVPELRAVTNTR